MPTAKISMPTPNPSTVIGIDVGDKRIGVAAVNLIARLPRPVRVLQNNESIFDEIAQIANSEGASKVVVGIPRNLDGQETQQSSKIREFAKELANKTELEIAFADESLSSKRAEAMLKDQGKPVGELDALAACFILEEFLLEDNNQHEA